MRVSRGCIILSLPNNWANARRPIARGRGAIGHYGLPLEPPVDRHKWFFSLAEARQFQTAVTIRATGAPGPIKTPQLGPVGGRIVAEVFLGMMFGENSSLLSLDPNWAPVTGPDFQLKDLVAYALGRGDPLH